MIARASSGPPGGGHELVIRRLLEEPSASDLAMKECKGLDGVPEKPLSPMEVAHDRWGKDSASFAAFGMLHKYEISAKKLPLADG